MIVDRLNCIVDNVHNIVDRFIDYCVGVSVKIDIDSRNIYSRERIQLLLNKK